MERKLSICVTAASNVGGREVNEDSYLAIYGEKAPCQTLGLFAVADGMGGSGNGHVASALTISTLADSFAAACEVSQGKPIASTRDLLRFAVQKSNAAVFQAAQKNKEHRGMGSTCTAVAINGDNLHIAHVGDSRAYLFRKDGLERLVEEEWIKQGRSNEGRQEEAGIRQRAVTFVNKAIGWQPLLTPEVSSVPLMEDDIVLICTDGLTDELSDEEIERMMQKSNDISDICNWLVNSACSVEECDNVTVVLVKMLATQS